MSFFAKLIVILALGLIEGTTVPIPLAMLTLTILSIYSEKQSTFLLAILAGIFLDILQVRIVGTTSLVFLVIVFVIFLYKRKLATKNPVFIGIAVFLSTIFYSFLIYQEFILALSQALMLTLLVLVPVLFRRILPIYHETR